MVKKSMKFGFKIGGKLIEELKMAGRWLREALGRHFGGSWEASKGYDRERHEIISGSGPPQQETKVS